MLGSNIPLNKLGFFCPHSILLNFSDIFTILLTTYTKTPNSQETILKIVLKLSSLDVSKHDPSDYLEVVDKFYSFLTFNLREFRHIFRISSVIFDEKEELPIVLNENLIKLELFVRSVTNLSSQETMRRHICHYKKDLIDLLLLFILGIDQALHARASLVTANA